MVAIVDYGAGNLTSVRLAFEKIGVRAAITSVPGEIIAADRVVFPGVGSAGVCGALKARYMKNGRPVLACCWSRISEIA